jgi:hypothetical protein
VHGVERREPRLDVPVAVGAAPAAKGAWIEQLYSTTAGEAARMSSAS